MQSLADELKGIHMFACILHEQRIMTQPCGKLQALHLLISSGPPAASYALNGLQVEIESTWLSNSVMKPGLTSLP